ncbi:MAG: SAM-dependent methyltransferase [Pseudolysinimonas sp.]
MFAETIAALVGQNAATTVVDLAAGGGELLAALLPIVGSDVELIGVEVAERPSDLPEPIQWTHHLPDRIDGLLIANEWLDNLPCDVVEVGDDGLVREVSVDPTTGEESLGGPYDSAWLDTWWALGQPGERAEVGAVRDDAWADAVARVNGIAIAIDYGHLRDDRPAFGTLRSYAHGREVDVIPDGTRDVTAHVAVDSVASAVGAQLIRQRDALARLGLDGSRPALELARSDPAAYVAALGHAGEAGELLATGGLGGFWWIVTDTAGHGTLSA